MWHGIVQYPSAYWAGVRVQLHHLCLHLWIGFG